MFYIEIGFKKLENSEKLIQKFCEDLYSLQSLKKTKEDIFGFEYKDCLLWDEISKENRILLLSEAGYGKTTEFKHRYEQDKNVNIQAKSEILKEIEILTDKRISQLKTKSS